MISREQLWDVSIAVMGRVYGSGVEEHGRKNVALKLLIALNI
jgi:hypothetical protein